MNEKIGFPLVCIGIGLIVGTFVGKLNFVQLLFLSIGLGLSMGSILRLIINLSKKIKTNNREYYNHHHIRLT